MKLTRCCRSYNTGASLSAHQCRTSGSITNPHCSGETLLEEAGQLAKSCAESARDRDKGLRKSRCPRSRVHLLAIVVNGSRRSEGALSMLILLGSYSGLEYLSIRLWYFQRDLQYLSNEQRCLLRCLKNLLERLDLLRVFITNRQKRLLAAGELVPTL